MTYPPAASLRPMLADHRGSKIYVVCEVCGLSRRYDATTMYERVGDISLIDLLPLIAQGEKCARTKNQFTGRCGVHYDLKSPMLTK
jgi:RNase P subunit RPR2